MTNQHTFVPHELKEPIKAPTRIIWSSYLAGVFYGDAHHIKDNLFLNQPVMLFAHGDNSYDNYAVGAYVKDEHGHWQRGGVRYSRVGWLPNKLAEDSGIKLVLWNMLRLGAPITARISSFATNADRITAVAVEVLYD